MRKKAAKPLIRMPLLGGVVMGHGSSARTLLKGVYVVGGKHADQVQKLFVDSARFTGSEPPGKFRMNEGEIFYEDGKIAEVRLRGTLPLEREEGWVEFPVMEDEELNVLPPNEGEEWDGLPLSVYEKMQWKVPSWSLGTPDFTWVDDLRLAFSPRDLGRSYVAALSIGGPLLLWWDVASGRHAYAPAGVDVRLIRVPQPAKRPGGRGDRAKFDAAIRYAETLAKSAREMKTLLKLMRDGGELDYIEQYRAFGHAFSPLLRQRINEGGPGGAGHLSFSMKGLGGTKMRHKLTNAAAAIARDRLIIKPGRPPGSKTKHRKLGSEQRAQTQKEKDDERRTVVLDVIEAEYRRLRQLMPAAKAEFEVKEAFVIAKSKIKRSTYFNWLRRIRCEFEDLKTEAIRRTEN